MNIKLEVTQDQIMVLTELLETADSERFKDWTTEKGEPITEDYLETLIKYLLAQTYGN